MASLWQKKTGVWCVTYREDGKQRVRSLRTKDKREALKLKRAIETMLDERGAVELHVSDRPQPEKRNPTLDEFWRDFHAWATGHRSQSTVEEYTNWFTQLREFTRADRLGEITRTDIEAFKAALGKQGKRKPKGVGLDKVSINNALKTLSAVWSHALKLGLFTGENPVASVERYNVPRVLDRDYLDKMQVDALLRAAEAYGDEKYVRRAEATNVYLAVALMAFAGLRRREVCFSRWDWISWEGRVMTVTSDGDFVTKNRRPRIISLNSQLVDILRPYAKAEGYILETVRAGEDRAEYRADFKKGFQKVCDIAGIRTTPHELRHSFASRHAVAGTSLHVIAGWLGHSTTWITQRYAHFQKTYNAAADNI